MAAGAGHRFGGPKALALTDGVPWVVRTVDVVRDAGVDPVLVVVGAAAIEVCAVLPAWVTVVRHEGWASGMGGSLRAGLSAAADLPVSVTAVVVMLVDLPGVTSSMLRTLVGVPGELLQASFGGAPGHPVLLGRAHWDRVAAAAHGDSGAREYLREHQARRVPLGSAAAGADVDIPGR
ncbi:MAG: nucleotidyltransferase family protein [Nakamurella sp.]